MLLPPLPSTTREKFDRPKCHPDTRVAVRDKIEKWALRKDPDTNEASIMWLSGAAGAGKSAIAQSMAEDFHSRGLLAASFFFGRSDSTRNHARSLVSTIVYQLLDGEILCYERSGGGTLALSPTVRDAVF